MFFLKARFRNAGLVTLFPHSSSYSWMKQLILFNLCLSTCLSALPFSTNAAFFKTYPHLALVMEICTFFLPTYHLRQKNLQDFLHIQPGCQNAGDPGNRLTCVSPPPFSSFIAQNIRTNHYNSFVFFTVAVISSRAIIEITCSHKFLLHPSGN